MLGQRYAFDLIRFDPRPGATYHPVGGVRALLLGVPTREAYGWGEPVHAPLDGQVIAAADGMAERQRIHPVRELLLALRNAVTFRPTPEHVARLMGNHVILSADGVYAGFRALHHRAPSPSRRSACAGRRRAGPRRAHGQLDRPASPFPADGRP